MTRIHYREMVNKTYVRLAGDEKETKSDIKF